MKKPKRQYKKRTPCQKTSAKKELQVINNFISTLHKNTTGRLPNKNQTSIDAIKDIYHFMDNIIAATPGYIYWLDTNNVYLGCNDEHAKNVGLAKKDIIGKTNADLPWKASATALDAANNTVMANKEKISTEESGSIISGGIKTVLTEKAPLYDRQGKVAGIIGTSIDITAHKKALELTQKKKIIEEKLAFMESLSGFMAHEMRTPLTALNICLDLLVGNRQINKIIKNHQYLSNIAEKGKEAVIKANNFIDMLLVKLRKMQKDPDKTEFMLCVMKDDIKDALDSYPFAQHERAKVTYNTNSAFIYSGNSILTQHIIYNLLKNALRVINEEEQGKITIRFKQNKNYNQLIFSDTAKGIPKHLLPTIFDAFAVENNSKIGANLGLAFCQTVMKSYGGSISCASREGKYTKFILNFPKVKDAELKNA